MRPPKLHMPRMGKPPIKMGASPKITQHIGKGSQMQMLPSRSALSTLVKGDPSQRTIQNYAKLTPVGSGAPGSYANIESMGLKGISLKD